MLTRNNFRAIITIYRGGFQIMARKNMLTSEQENIIKKYVNSRTYDIKKLIQYLTIHDEVGSGIS